MADTQIILCKIICGFETNQEKRKATFQNTHRMVAFTITPFFIFIITQVVMLYSPW